MQPCNRIYYSNVYWRLNMFRAAHRSSSGALNCICSLWFIYTCGDRPFTTCVYKPEAANTVLELMMMSGVPLETCWAFNKLWNNFYYKVASCWLFLLIHVTHASWLSYSYTECFLRICNFSKTEPLKIILHWLVTYVPTSFFFTECFCCRI